MILRLYLIAFVSWIISWIVVNENMGLLNFLFEPINTGNETSYRIILNATQFWNFLISVIKRDGIPLSVLESLPTEIVGQEAGQISRENPNREAIIIWITVSALLLFQIFITFILVANCCFCCGQKDVCFLLISNQ